jgi:Phosphodiester glycosidase
MTVVAAWSALAGGGFLGAGTADAAGSAVAVSYAQRVEVAPGVEYQEFAVTASHGQVDGHLVSVDLREPHVGVDLLHAPSVAQREPVSELADAQGAVAGVNGDFFNISETHAGVEPTGSSDGPAIADGRQLKAAVPNGQRFGPALPPGTSTQDVIGVGVDGTARLDRLTLAGSAVTPGGTIPVRGLNQYAVPVGGVGAFTPDWGTVSRVRATCGTDKVRSAPCSTDTYEVTVAHGVVTAVSDTPGSGAIAPGAVVLVGREAGADALRALSPGDRVRVSYHLAEQGRVPLRFAVGGFPILRDGAPLAGLDTVTAATRTAAGFGSGGHRFYLLALDGAAETSAGLTISELSSLMRDVGADAAVNLDGGGSTTLVTRDPGATGVTVRNHPGGGAERPVPNGIGIFTHP